jgi:hypothetical protein
LFKPKVNVVYDPFAGTATRLVVCKSRGIESYGVEAHPFVYQVATVKTFWNYGKLDALAAQWALEIQYKNRPENY